MPIDSVSEYISSAWELGMRFLPLTAWARRESRLCLDRLAPRAYFRKGVGRPSLTGTRRAMPTQRRRGTGFRWNVPVHLGSPLQIEVNLTFPWKWKYPHGMEESQPDPPPLPPAASDSLRSRYRVVYLAHRMLSLSESDR